MGDTPPQDPPALEAKSPFEMRVNLGKDVPETDVRSALATGDMGFLHSYTTGSAVDGPGVRVVAWTTGCMWRCRYCHNPDTWHKFNGQPVTVARAMQVIGKYAKVLKISKGGLTLSGGEPMLQYPFVMEVFRRCKQLGLHTCLDTSGRLGDRFTDQDLMAIDLNLLDIKSGDPTIYEKLTGDVGVFATKICYVTKSDSRFELQVSDADGYNADFILAHKEPIISPQWSPDGTRIAYVSFERRKPIVFIHNLVDGTRTVLANYEGSNSAPAWSPAR